MQNNAKGRARTTTKSSFDCKTLLCKNIVLLVALAAINVTTQRKITTFLVNFNTRSKVYPLVSLYDCEELLSRTIYTLELFLKRV